MNGHTAAQSGLDALEHILGHHFHDPALLQQAFLHSSHAYENPETSAGSYERLEFLGDAWLGYVVAEELFRRYPDIPEGDLTKLRAAVVQGQTLARIAKELGFGDRLVMGRGEERTGGRDRRSNLAAVYEAVVGALILDGGEQPARAFILRTLDGPLQEAGAGGEVARDYKSALQEYCQARHWDPPRYTVDDVEGPPHARSFTVAVTVQEDVLGTARGKSRRAAEKEAARMALDRLTTGRPKEQRSSA